MTAVTLFIYKKQEFEKKTNFEDKHKKIDLHLHQDKKDSDKTMNNLQLASA